MAAANITVEHEVHPVDHGAKAKATIDHAIVVRTHDLSKMVVRFHMYDEVTADDLGKMFSGLLDSMSIVDMQIEWSSEITTTDFNSPYINLRDRVIAMSRALRKKGLGAWVRDWLSDGILDGKGLN